MERVNKMKIFNIYDCDSHKEFEMTEAECFKRWGEDEFNEI